MNAVTLFLLTFLFGFTQCQKSENGLEIYLVNKANEHTNRANETPCSFCLDINVEDLNEKALLTEEDIDEFDFTNQQIKLTEEGKQKLQNIEIPLQGLPVALVLNGEIIYGFWFWNEYSSFGCDRVYTYPTMDFKIKFGLPESNTYGDDPRFDHRLENYISRKK